VLWGWILCTPLLVALWLIGNKRRVGHLVGLGSELLWLYFATVVRFDTGFIFFSLVYGGMYARNYVKWRRDDLG
jgi:hypothetical protein